MAARITSIIGILEPVGQAGWRHPRNFSQAMESNANGGFPMRGCVPIHAGRTVRAVSVACALAAALAFSVRAQQPAGGKEPLVFEVASVKPTPPDERRGIVHQLPGGQSYEAIGAPLRMIMTVAYTVTDRQISGGPDWINSERWNIEAKAERRGTSDELHDALARLLEDRFKLKVRHETRDLPAYLLTVDKKGPKMPLHDAADLLHEPIGGSFQNGELHMNGLNVMMNYFAFFLSRILDLNVVDKTGLTGHYDVDFHYVRELPPGARLNGDAPPPMADGPDIFTALREQLGLRLEKGRGPVDFLVIEHVEKPSEN
jgi:uncharacterized protein (TIGR03435 family)